MNIMVDAMLLTEISGSTPRSIRRIKTFSKSKVKGVNSLKQSDFDLDGSTGQENVLTTSAVRCDKFGNEIIRGKKLHKVSFADQFNKSLVEKNTVVSFKKHNKEEEKLERGICFECQIF